MKSVYSAVRTGSLNKAYWSRDTPTSLTFNNCTLCQHCIYVFCIYLRTNSVLCHLQINCLVFITEMKSVCNAVRTGALNKAYWSRDAPTSLTFNNCTLCQHCIYEFCIYLRTNSDLCHLQHKLIGLYNRDEKCLQHGTEWVFK